MPAKKKSQKSKSVPASIVWFEIPADDTKRARTFYSKLFGWKFDQFPNPKEYWHIDTAGADASPDGGLIQRQHPDHRGFANYILVASVDKTAAKAKKLGATICMGKTAVPNMGYFVFCQDTEGNMFALWEANEKAK